MNPRENPDMPSMFPDMARTVLLQSVSVEHLFLSLNYRGRLKLACFIFMHMFACSKTGQSYDNNNPFIYAEKI